MKTTQSNLTTIRPDIRQMKPYMPVPYRTGGIRLDLGESPYGVPSCVRAALRDGDTDNRYPDPGYTELRTAIGAYTKQSIDRITVGSGSDELIDLWLRLFLMTGDSVINCPPTFGMYSPGITLNCGKEVIVPRKNDFSIDVDRIIAAIDPTVKIIIICSPNNPTGTPCGNDDLIRILQTGITIIVDEAYAEFSSTTCLSLVSQYPNLIVLRTFSKWGGIAGLRIGYSIADPYLATELMKIKPPYNVNAPAERAARAILVNSSVVNKMVQQSIDQRTRVSTALTVIPECTVYPSDANCVFVQTQWLGVLRKTLESKNIFLRYFDNLYTGPSFRMTIGTAEQNRTVCDAIAQFYDTTRVDGIIFDMDGVLFDTSRSYDECIKASASYVLKNTYGVTRRIQDTDIAFVRRIPGFNNDWDTTYALICAYRQIDVSSPASGFPTRCLSKNDKQSRMYAYAKDIFQAFYLGNTQYSSIYKEISPIDRRRGYMESEILLADLSILKKLARQYPLAIATGRPKYEALLSLRRCGITPNIIPEECVVGKEDARREKPFSDPLREAKKRGNMTRPLYIGDTINDQIAAKKADMPFVSIGPNSSGDMCLSNVNELSEVFV
jgi:histidinol-phosphate aminotransferase